MLVLASQSPRRRELLASLGVDFQTHSVDIVESVRSSEAADRYVSRLALEKAQAGLAQRSDAQWVLGSDTTVAIDGQILVKPESEADYQAMMRTLSGRTHQVFTAVALVSQQTLFETRVCTDVTFTELTEDYIQHYWQTGEPADKAGGYGIQGLGAIFVEEIRGSYSNVVGLPLHETARLLGQAGLPIWQGRLRLVPSNEQ
ncbi:Maf family protein [Reinekea blandensis]|uniref:dTTP/UTP pyrophosphatase n=1 Tax=Reinekea blandensis MED297 TaxID=314283 RepID=A4BGL5_9GAMM|nr:Maf family protein [Reinekea blandensis]EAR08663.1 maf protein [Reinekea sp. MED297] [Reinekea blandensis MED297]